MQDGTALCRALGGCARARGEEGSGDVDLVKRAVARTPRGDARPAEQVEPLAPTRDDRDRPIALAARGAERDAVGDVADRLDRADLVQRSAAEVAQALEQARAAAPFTAAAFAATTAVTVAAPVASPAAIAAAAPASPASSSQAFDPSD